MTTPTPKCKKHRLTILYKLEAPYVSVVADTGEVVYLPPSLPPASLGVMSMKATDQGDEESDGGQDNLCIIGTRRNLWDVAQPGKTHTGKMSLSSTTRRSNAKLTRQSACLLRRPNTQCIRRWNHEMTIVAVLMQLSMISTHFCAFA